MRVHRKLNHTSSPNRSKPLNNSFQGKGDYLDTSVTPGLLCPLCRVEDRNDSMLQKMRRYIKAFSKEDEKETEGFEKTDTIKGSRSGSLNLRPKNKGGFNRRTLTGWQMIRHSALGLEMEQEEPEEDQDIKHV